MRIILILLLFIPSIYGQDFETLSIDQRTADSKVGFWDLSKLDLSIFSSISTLRHWQTKRISTYTFDNSVFVGYGITKNSYLDMKGKFSTYKNFGEAASFGDKGDTNFTELTFKYSLRHLLAQNSLGISLSLNLEHSFYTYKNAHIYSNKTGYSQVTLLFSKFVENMAFYMKPYFSNNYIAGSKSAVTGESIDTVRSAVGVSWSQYFNLSKKFYLYSGQSYNHYFGYYRPGRDTFSLSFGVGGNIHKKVGYYIGANFYNVFQSSDDRLFGEDFYKYPSFGMDLYFFLF